MGFSRHGDGSLFKNGMGPEWVEKDEALEDDSTIIDVAHLAREKLQIF